MLFAERATSVLDATGVNVRTRARARTHAAARIRHASESFQTCFLIPSACFVQFAPHGVAGAMQPDRSSERRTAAAIAANESTFTVCRRPPPPSLPQRPQCFELARCSPPLAAQGFQTPPCRMPCSNPCLRRVVHPSTMHRPCAPCLVQRPRPAGRGLQP